MSGNWNIRQSFRMKSSSTRSGPSCSGFWDTVRNKTPILTIVCNETFTCKSCRRVAICLQFQFDAILHYPGHERCKLFWRLSAKYCHEPDVSLHAPRKTLRQRAIPFDCGMQMYRHTHSYNLWCAGRKLVYPYNRHPLLRI